MEKNCRALAGCRKCEPLVQGLDVLSLEEIEMYSSRLWLLLDFSGCARQALWRRGPSDPLCDAGFRKAGLSVPRGNFRSPADAGLRLCEPGRNWCPTSVARHGSLGQKLGKSVTSLRMLRHIPSSRLACCSVLIRPWIRNIYIFLCLFNFPRALQIFAICTA